MLGWLSGDAEPTAANCVAGHAPPPAEPPPLDPPPEAEEAEAEPEAAPAEPAPEAALDELDEALGAPAVPAPAAPAPATTAALDPQLGAIAASILAAANASAAAARAAQASSERAHALNVQAIESAILEANQNVCQAVKAAFHHVLNETQGVAREHCVASAEAATARAIEGFEQRVDALIGAQLENKLGASLAAHAHAAVAPVLEQTVTDAAERAVGKAVDGKLAAVLEAEVAKMAEGLGERVDGAVRSAFAARDGAAGPAALKLNGDAPKRVEVAAAPLATDELDAELSALLDEKTALPAPVAAKPPLPEPPKLADDLPPRRMPAGLIEAEAGAAAPRRSGPRRSRDGS